MGGAAAAATEVTMDLTQIRCMCCGQTGMSPATTTIVQKLDGVKVTIDGVPAMRCQACGEISLAGKVMIPIDEAIEDIMVAAGVAARPTPEEDAEVRAQNLALAHTLGQGDTLLDDPSETPTGQPSGAGTIG